jgi:hypothetical protein
MIRRVLLACCLVALLITEGCGLLLSHYACHKYGDPEHGCDRQDTR